MATTEKKLNVTELDFDDIKNNLKTFMRNQNDFTDYDFEGSGINSLLDVLAYNTHYLAMNLNMASNESFLDTASIRSSVVSHAKTLGYTPSSPRAPKATLNIELNNFGALTTATIPIGFVFTTSLDDVSYQFVTTAEHTTRVANNVIRFTDIPIFEGTYVTNRYTVDSQNVEQKFTLNSDRADTTTLLVDVFDNASSTSSTTFTLTDDLTVVKATSNNYFLQESIDGKFEVYFGDGIVGKKLSDGNVVRLRYVVTNKTESNGADTFSSSGAISGITDFDILTVSEAEGGADRESIQSIKLNAPLDFAAQGRAVSTNDFKAIIPKVYPNTQSVQVYGGEDNDVPFYGRVYISIVPTIGTITASAKKQIVDDLKKTYTIASVTPIIVDPEFTDIRISTVFQYNAKNTTKAKETLESNVRTSILNYGTQNLSKFDGAFRYSQVVGIIDNADEAITSNITTVKLSKRITPTLNVGTKYIIPFGNALFNPHGGHMMDSGGIVSSTGFFISGDENEMFLNDDGNGNIRLFFLTDGTTITYKDTTAGTINYKTGEIILTNLNITSVSSVDSVASSSFRILVTPDSNDVLGVRNQVLRLDTTNLTVNATTDTIASGSTSAGVGATTVSSYSGETSTTSSASTSTSSSSEVSTGSSSGSSSGY
tara:strand:- start:1686 stop:3647 length:1962 start_codon:yes stop_codon:yes gene_type:complete